MKMKHAADSTSFMRYMIDDFDKQLELPPAFVKRFGRRLDGTFVKGMGRCVDGEYQVRVWGSGGSHCWIVEVEKEGDGFFFRNKWPEFVEDNNIGYGDVLVFSCDGRNKFRVKIFDPTGVKRNMALMFPKDEDAAVEAQNEGNFEGIDEYMSMDLNEGNKEDDSQRTSVDFDAPPIYYVDGKGECHFEVRGVCKKEIQGSMELSQEESPCRMEIKETEMKDHDCSETARTETLDSFAVKVDNELGCERSSQKESLPHFEEEETKSVKESSVLPPFSSCNTYFIATWSPTWLHYLTIPKEIAIEKDLHSKSQLLIRDFKGKTWFVKLSTKEDGTINLTDGWSKFCNSFEFGKGDTCTFEFISSRIVHAHISSTSR